MISGSLMVLMTVSIKSCGGGHAHTQVDGINDAAVPNAIRTSYKSWTNVARNLCIRVHKECSTPINGGNGKDGSTYTSTPVYTMYGGKLHT